MNNITQQSTAELMLQLKTLQPGTERKAVKDELQRRHEEERVPFVKVEESGKVLRKRVPPFDYSLL